MTNIFISYNRKAEAITKALADDFEDLGHTVWFDQEISGGQAWWDQILAEDSQLRSVRLRIRTGGAELHGL